MGDNTEGLHLQILKILDKLPTHDYEIDAEELKKEFPEISWDNLRKELKILHYDKYISYEDVGTDFWASITPKGRKFVRNLK